MQDREHDRTPGSRMVSAIETAYSAVQEICPELPPVLFVLGTGADPRRPATLKLGHYAHGRWSSVTDPTAHVPEILITGQGLQRGGRDTFATIVHESAHALAAVRRLQETSRQGRYHNRVFRGLAEELGMVYRPAKPCPKLGYSAVTLADETATAFAVEIGRLDRAIRLAIDAGTFTNTRPPPSKPRNVTRVSFTDTADEVDMSAKLYKQLARNLSDHYATEVTL